MRRRPAAVVAALAVALTLTGCGQQKQPISNAAARILQQRVENLRVAAAQQDKTQFDAEVGALSRDISRFEASGDITHNRAQEIRAALSAVARDGVPSPSPSPTPTPSPSPSTLSPTPAPTTPSPTLPPPSPTQSPPPPPVSSAPAPAPSFTVSLGPAGSSPGGGEGSPGASAAAASH